MSLLKFFYTKITGMGSKDGEVKHRPHLKRDGKNYVLTTKGREHNGYPVLTPKKKITSKSVNPGKPAKKQSKKMTSFITTVDESAVDFGSAIKGNDKPHVRVSSKEIDDYNFKLSINDEN